MGVLTRPLVAADRDAVHEALVACGVFTDEEVRVALDVLASGLAGDYTLFAAELAGTVRGYVCISPTPLTLDTWHLYWICVHPSAQHAGVGRALQSHAEAFVRTHGGARLVLETSGTPRYVRARAFYERAGYVVAGRIPDFYRPGDDCVVYTKTLRSSAAG